MWVRNEKNFATKHSFRPYEPQWEVQHSLSNTIVKELQDLSKNLIHGVELIGGEPLIEPFTLNTISALTKQNPDIRISLITNLTSLPDSFMKVLEQAKNLHFHLSIDGVGTTYEWIRGTPYKPVQHNLQKLAEFKPQCIGKIAPALSIYNVLRLREMFTELREYKPVSLTRIVYYPEYLGANLLPAPLKKKVAEDLEWIRQKRLGDSSFEREAKRLLQFLQKPMSEPHSILLKRLRLWTEYTNKIRNQKVWDLQPELEFLR